MVKKAVSIKAKANLQSRATIKNMDQHCPWGSRSANSTIAKNQGQSIKDPWKEELKVRALESTIPCSTNPEFSAKASEGEERPSQTGAARPTRSKILHSGQQSQHSRAR